MRILLSPSEARRPPALGRGEGYRGSPLAWRSLWCPWRSPAGRSYRGGPGRLCAAGWRPWLLEPSGARPPDSGSALLPKAEASRPADPPPSSHWARFEQESRQPLSLANGRRRPRRRAGRAGPPRDSCCSWFWARRPRFLASVAGSCHKGGDAPGTPAAATAKALMADVFPRLLRLAATSLLCGRQM